MRLLAIIKKRNFGTYMPFLYLFFIISRKKVYDYSYYLCSSNKFTLFLMLHFIPNVMFILLYSTSVYLFFEFFFF